MSSPISTSMFIHGLSDSRFHIMIFTICTCIKCLFAKWDALPAELQRIGEEQHAVLDLDPYVKKLMNARRRVVLVNNILQNAQERLGRLNHHVAREAARLRAMLTSGSSVTPLEEKGKAS
uniref:Biogenesis of lysosome-related organelles complex 1 subunit 7 n=1 Tax=Eptatretus burgeri TaxID=7764 RepID=A0A8C4QUP5_EPTBU